MAIEERTIGHVTINNEIGLDDQMYTIGYWVNDDYFILNIPRQLVQREFRARGKAKGVVSHYNDPDNENEHELTFDEWESNMQYRDEIDSFIQELAAEQLNLSAVATLKDEEGRVEYLVNEVAELNIKYNLSLMGHSAKDHTITGLRERVRTLEKTLYELTNQNIKKAS
jgi:hypothetical protein